jgi:hypothetical protein
MAIDEFWQNVRLGARLNLPTRVISDTPRMDDEVIKNALANSHSWLTPKSVQGFDPADFAFLPPEERNRLTENVNGFLALAKTVDPKKPATAEQVEAATPFFTDIVKSLEFDRFADAEAYRVGKTIESDPSFPHDDVKDARYRIRRDWNGEPSIKIMTYLPDSSLEEFLERAKSVRKVIMDLVFERGQPYFPYPSTRIMSNLAELQTVGEDE